jgi:hypothetical protein
LLSPKKPATKADMHNTTKPEITDRFPLGPFCFL